MPLTALPRLAVGVAIVLLAAAGCAQKSGSRTPTAIPSVPSAGSPAPPTDQKTATSTKEDPAAGKQGEKAAEKAGGQTRTGGGAAKADRGEKAGGAGADGGQPVTPGGQAAGGAQTPEERKDGLDRELQTSMADFEGMLRREQERLEDKQRRDPLPERAGQSGSGPESGGEAGAEKAGGSGEKAGSEKEDRAGGAQAGGAEGGEDTATGGSGAGRSDGGTPVTAPVEGSGSGTDATPVPKDVGDGRDDDVVARQLREAAMKEKDPGVREKLWQEYRDYKKGAGKD